MATTLAEVRDAAAALLRCALEADLRLPRQTLSEDELADVETLLRDLAARLPALHTAALAAFAYARLRRLTGEER